jgi:hypothetical protein
LNCNEILVQGWPSRSASRAALRGQHLARAMYSKLKYIKSKYRSVLTDEHLTELVETALTIYQPSYKTLIAYPKFY